MAEAIHVDRDGRSIPYKLLRTFPPEAQALATVAVGDADRLDLLAYRFYGDPEQFWRICDANRALRPDNLFQPVGRRLTIPVPESS